MEQKIAPPDRQPPIRKHDSWAWQADAYHFAYDRDETMLAMGMGSGKTKVAVDLCQNWEAQTILVLAPVKVLGVWLREFDMWAKTKFNVVVLDKGPSSKKALVAKKAYDEAVMFKRPTVIVISYESARSTAFKGFSLSCEWDVVILDESHKAKGNATATGKYCGRLFPISKRRLCLTGTPMPHSPLDIFSQARFLNPRFFGYRFVAFRRLYAISHPVFPTKILSWINQKGLKRILSKFAFRVTSDILDLPPATHHHIEVELSEKAMAAYNEMRDDMITQVRQGVITAANGLVKLLRLQQITSGVVRPDDSEDYVRIDDRKMAALNNLLMNEIPDGEPVIVFCRFSADLDAIAKVAAAWDLRYGEISGQRKDLTDHATMPDNIDVMGVQIQSGGVGIDLTRACHCVYWSVGFSLGDYEQSLARPHRPGQDRPVRFYHLVAKGTVDETVYKALDDRRDLVESVLEALKTQETVDESVAERV